jgi:DNA-binding transcriptional regulator YiaG|nr:hypothetical protein [uncultured Rhodopila sp.]
MLRNLEYYEEKGIGLPYPVILLNIVQELIDDRGERIGTRIPNLQGLSATVAIARCLHPLKLRGAEVRFIRRVLDVNQMDFSAQLELGSVESISRWENDVRPVGDSVDKLLRFVAIASLRELAPGISAAADSKLIQLRIQRRHSLDEWPRLVITPTSSKGVGIEYTLHSADQASQPI